MGGVLTNSFEERGQREQESGGGHLGVPLHFKMGEIHILIGLLWMFSTKLGICLIIVKTFEFWVERCDTG
jgi:hypothetical protein